MPQLDGEVTVNEADANAQLRVDGDHDADTDGSAGLDLGDDVSTKPTSRGHLALLASMMVFPARAAVGVLSFLVGRSMARRKGASDAGVTGWGIFAAAAVQCILPRGGANDEDDAELREAAERGVAWSEALSAVSQVLRRFSSGLVPQFQFLEQRIILLGHGTTWSKLAETARVRPRRSSSRLLAKAARYCDFAMMTYGYALLSTFQLISPAYDWQTQGKRAHDIAVYHLGVSPDAVLRDRLDGDTIGVPRHLAVIDPNNGNIIVAIRGTSSVADLFTDLLCESKPFANGYAHAGMADAAKALFASLAPVFKNYPRRTIVVCGHSLGAGVALLLTKLLVDVGHRVECYAFAPCPVFGPLDALDDAWSSAVECFVHAEDVVASLSLASARRLALELEASRDTPPSPHDDLRLASVPPLYIPTHAGVHWLLPVDRPTIPWWRRFRTGINAKALFPKFPWHRWDIPSSARPFRQYESFVVDTRTFERMLITAQCVGAHFPSSYVQAFSALNANNPAVAERWRAPPPSQRPNSGPFFGELGEL